VKGKGHKKDGRHLYEPIPPELKRTHAQWEGREEGRSSRDCKDRI